MSERLAEVTDDSSFEAARAYEAQEPMDKSREPVLKPRHESNVHDEPDEPRDSAREPHPMRAEDGAAAVYGGHAPEVPVLPGSRLGALSDTVSDDVGGVETGLKGNLGNAWEIVIVHHVADCEHLRMTRQRTFRFHLDAASPVALSTGGVRQHFRQR